MRLVTFACEQESTGRHFTHSPPSSFVFHPLRFFFLPSFLHPQHLPAHTPHPPPTTFNNTHNTRRPRNASSTLTHSSRIHRHGSQAHQQRTHRPRPVCSSSRPWLSPAAARMTWLQR